MEPFLLVPPVYFKGERQGGESALGADDRLIRKKNARKTGAGSLRNGETGRPTSGHKENNGEVTKKLVFPF